MIFFSFTGNNGTVHFLIYLNILQRKHITFSFWAKTWAHPGTRGRITENQRIKAEQRVQPTMSTSAAFDLPRFNGLTHILTFSCPRPGRLD